MENKKSINNIEYILAGDYYIPDLKLPNEERPIGKYGQMHREHLKEHNPTNFISSCPLYLQNRTPNRQHQYTIGLGFSLFCKLFYRSRIGTNQRASRFRSLCRFSNSSPLMMSRRICSSV